MKGARQTSYAALGSAFSRATDDLVVEVCRLDARLAASGLADGWQNRCDINEAFMAIQSEGFLVDLTDLVLHDGNLNKREPTAELVRASSILRAYRVARQRPAPWPLTKKGLASLAGGLSSKEFAEEITPSEVKPKRKVDDIDPLSDQFAEIDALIERTGRVLRGEVIATRARSLVAGASDERQFEAEDRWFGVLQDLERLPAVQAAAFGWQAWRELGVHDRQPWLGLIIAGAILRSRGLTASMLPLAAAYRKAGYRGRQLITKEMAVGTFCELLSEALRIANSDLSTLSLHRELMAPKLAGRRKGSKLNDLVDLFLSRPLVTMPLARKQLNVTAHAVKCMFDELGPSLPRELTQRSRYRAWGII
jgi:hypothetical protein